MSDVPCGVPCEKLIECERELDEAVVKYQQAQVFESDREMVLRDANYKLLAENRALREALKDAVDMLPVPAPWTPEYSDYQDVRRNLLSVAHIEDT